MLAPSSLKRAIRTSTRLKEPATELVPALKHCPANLSEHMANLPVTCTKWSVKGRLPTVIIRTDAHTVSVRIF